MHSHQPTYVLRGFPPRPLDDLDSGAPKSMGQLNSDGLDRLNPKDLKHTLYAAQVFVDLFLRKIAEDFVNESEVVRSSVTASLEKSLEDLVLSWLDSRGLPARHSGERFMSFKTLLMENLTLAHETVPHDTTDNLKRCADKAEYRNLARTLRVMPTGAIRSATQERLAQILEKLGDHP